MRHDQLHVDHLIDFLLLPGAFRLYDINGDKVIERDELLLIVQPIYKMIGSMVELPPDEDTPEHVWFRFDPLLQRHALIVCFLTSSGWTRFSAA